jgi:endo-1,4-beta-xylanase
LLTRRAVLLGAAGATAASLLGCAGSDSAGTSAPATSGAAPPPRPPACPDPPSAAEALWRTAQERGIVYGSSTATWQVSDPQYRRLFTRQAAILFTEDDLLWYRLKPTPDAELDFRFGDQLIGLAEKQGMLVFGAHLVWDEGFGDGWTDSDLYLLDAPAASELLFGTVERTVKHYRGRVAAWSVVNEAVDGNGLRSDYPWHSTIGPSYIPDAFRTANEADPDALLLYNDFGFETDDDFAPTAAKRRATLELLDGVVADDVPVHGLGVQAHLEAGGFAEAFDARAYRQFLADVADRGLKIMITELDVLDDGLPADVGPRDRAVADVYRRYLEAALDEPAVVSLMNFGLSDRYTWLEEDTPRDDGAPRRPLAFDDGLRPKPAYAAIQASLREAPTREAIWQPPRADC